jgi:hypothetical protein
MLRKLLKVTTVAALGLLAIVLAQSGSIGAQEKKDTKDEKKTTKQIMAAGHKGADALFDKVKTAAKEKKWDDAVTPAKELAENGALFPKATPPKGEAKSWEDLSGKYAENTKALSEAVGKKDEAAAGKAITAIGGSCKACHDAHKGKK